MKLNLTTNMGMLLPGIWLIVSGLLQALSVGDPIIHVLLALLAIAAGVLIVLSKDGCLDYMVLAPGGFLGIGDRLIPIP
ncbi:MAG: hypothetical protein AB9866_20010 [Syntrophobacteraceae bacterium]